MDTPRGVPTHSELKKHLEFGNCAKNEYGFIGTQIFYTGEVLTVIEVNGQRKTIDESYMKDFIKHFNDLCDKRGSTTLDRFNFIKSEH